MVKGWVDNILYQNYCVIIIDMHYWHN